MPDDYGNFFASNYYMESVRLLKQPMPAEVLAQIQTIFLKG
jgi:hypothetical protein